MSKFIKLSRVVDAGVVFGRIMVAGAVMSVVLGIFGVFGLVIKKIFNDLGVVPAELIQTMFGYIITYSPYVFLVGLNVMLSLGVIYYVDHDCTLREAVYAVFVEGEMF